MPIFGGMGDSYVPETDDTYEINIIIMKIYYNTAKASQENIDFSETE